MIETHLLYSLLLFTSLSFSLFVTLTEKEKPINLIQWTLLSVVLLSSFLANLFQLLALDLMFMTTFILLLLFLSSIIVNLKIVEYLDNKKGKSNILSHPKLFILLPVLFSSIALMAILITKGSEKIGFGTTSFINIILSFAVISFLTLRREITTIKILEETSISIPLLLSVSLLLINGSKNVQDITLPLTLTPLLYSAISLISPFAKAQETKLKTFASFLSITFIILPSLYIFIVSLINSELLQASILPITGFVFLLSTLLSITSHKLITRKVNDITISVIKHYLSNIKDSEIPSLTIGTIVDKLHTSVEKFLGKNTIEVFTFNETEKTLKSVLLIDEKGNTIIRIKHLGISAEELNTITSKSNRFFTPHDTELQRILNDLDADIVIPITYGYTLKLIVSISTQDKFEMNISTTTFISEIFHLLLLETQATITKGLFKGLRHNVLLFVKDLGVKQTITSLLVMNDYETYGVNTFAEALKLLEKINIDMVICDNEVDDKAGISLIKNIKSDPLKRNIFCVIGFYKADENSAKEFLESLADLQIFFKNEFHYLNDTISFITYSLMGRKKIENTFKSIITLSSSSTLLLSKILGYKSTSFDEIEFEILSKLFLQPNINIPSFLIVGKINNTFIHSKVFAILRERQVIFVDSLNIPLEFYSRKKFGRNKVMWSDHVTEGIPPSEFSKSFAKEILHISNVIYNFLAISIEDSVLIGINFFSKISSWDIDLMRSLLVNYLLIKAVYEEVKEVDNAFIYTMQSLARAAEEMDEETGMHIYRVGEYSRIISRYLGFSEDFSNSIYYASQMHDIGKLKIPREILRKPGPLTPEEYEIMKEHTIAGALILGDHQKLIMARDIALGHHEKWDGSGYPYGLEKDKTPISARIVNLVDIYDALRSPRTYKPAFDHERVVEIITKGNHRTKPHHFDPDILQAFTEIHHKFNEIYEKYKEQ
ncbi:MAG: HD domain-containing phosphohydrolase [Brevinematia bacterium]